MSNANRNLKESEKKFLRQSKNLRDNIYKWDRMLHSRNGEDWPQMLGRVNAAFNQSGQLDSGIQDVMEHVVYQPKKSTVNPQDIPFFLSTRLADNIDDVLPGGDGSTIQTPEGGDDDRKRVTEVQNPVLALARYESRVADFATEYEERMVRF